MVKKRNKAYMIELCTQMIELYRNGKSRWAEPNKKIWEKKLEIWKNK